MSEFIGNLLGSRQVLSANRTPLLGELGGSMPPRPLTRRHISDMPVRWSHLSTADCHLVRQLVVHIFHLSLCSYPIWSDAH